METILVSTAGLCVLYFFGPPLITYFTFRVETEPTFESVASRADLPEAVQLQFQQADEDMEEIGFQPMETLFLPKLIGNVRSAMAFYLQPEREDFAISVASYVRQEDRWKLHSQYTEFSTRTADGRNFGSRNLMGVGAFPVPDHVTNIFLPGDTTVAKLYACHEGLTAGAGIHARSPLFFEQYAGVASAYLAHCMREELSYALDCGYLKIKSGSKAGDDPNPFKPLADDSSEYYVPTLKGALLMTWNELWPVKQLNIWRHRRKSLGLLRQVGKTL